MIKLKWQYEVSVFCTKHVLNQINLIEQLRNKSCEQNQQWRQNCKGRTALHMDENGFLVLCLPLHVFVDGFQRTLHGWLHSAQATLVLVEESLQLELEKCVI
jgi:hypothetical protein